jgi:hypothetical protein
VLTGSLAVGGGLLVRALAAADRPAVPRPRSTSGDETIQPNWKERVTISVGPQEADLVGANEKVLQSAVDYVARLGPQTQKIKLADNRFAGLSREVEDLRT